MIKYICQFSCWRMGPLVFYVMASEVVSKTVLHLLITRDGKSVEDVSKDGHHPDWCVYPVKYVGMPAMVRVRCREALTNAVQKAIGNETLPPYHESWETIK